MRPLRKRKRKIKQLEMVALIANGKFLEYLKDQKVKQRKLSLR